MVEPIVASKLTTEPARLPERFTTENQLTALYARLAADRDALNPQKKDLPETTENQLTNLQETVTKAAIASTIERRNIDYTKEGWADMMVEGFNKQGNAPLVQRLQLRRIGGMDFSHPTRETFLSAYQKYFADDGQGAQVEVVIKEEKQYIPARLNQFIEDILAAYPNKADLKADLSTIEWFSGIFGGESKKIVRSILETKLILEDAPQKQKLVNDANEKAKKDDRETSRLNWLGGQNGEEERQLQFLWENSHGIQRKMIERTVTVPPPPTPVTPPSVEPAKPAEEQKPFEPDKTYALEDMFAAVVGDIDPSQPYFVHGEPKPISITPDTIDRFVFPQPKNFFLIDRFDPKTKQSAWHTNPDVVPYVWQLGLGMPHYNLRFENGEKATDGDSGLFGLAAASAETPAHQAKLYRELATAIMTIHKMKHHQVLRDWLVKQAEPQKGLSSLALFATYDHTNGQLRPENERLLQYDKSGGLALNTPTDIVEWLDMWDRRIVDINMAMQNNQLQKHHTRWLEFLSHSINVAELMNAIKTQAPAGTH